MEKYLAYDSINNEYEKFETIEEAREWLTESFLIDGEGYHPDLLGCKIYKIEETVSFDVTDSKDNYAPGEWPHSEDFDETWKHKFEKQ